MRIELKPAHQKLAIACTKRVRERYNQNDLAHRIDHAHQVMRDAVWIATKLSCEHLIPQLITAAYYHDAWRVNPDDHHELAYEGVFMDKQWIIQQGGANNDEEIRNIALACLEHRASWSGKHSTIVSEIISSADRGAPDRVTVEDRIKRSYDYARGTLGYSHIHAQVHALRYVKDRFGSDGNARYPNIYVTVYDKLLDEQARKIDDLKDTDIHWHKLMIAYGEKSGKANNDTIDPTSDEMSKPTLFEAGTEALRRTAS